MNNNNVLKMNYNVLCIKRYKYQRQECLQINSYKYEQCYSNVKNVKSYKNEQ